MTQSADQWRISPSDLVGLTPEKARDLLVECFFQAQKETFAKVEMKLGKDATDDNLRRKITGAVQAGMKEVGGDYDEPTVASLWQTVQLLASRAGGWGTPKDVIQHHREQIESVLKVLKVKNNTV